MKYIRRIVLGVAMILALVACGKDSKVSNDAMKTCFIEYAQSIVAGENVLDLIFYCNENDLTRWRMENIEELYIEIQDKENGNSKIVEGEISYLDVSEKAIFDAYYAGAIGVKGNFREASGNAYLCIQNKDDTEVKKYELGVCNIIKKENKEFEEINEFVCGGVVKADEQENVFTYGIVIHMGVENAITISGIDLGIDMVGIDNEEYIIYTPEEYQSQIFDSLEQTTFDQIVEEAYTKKYVEELDSTLNLTLEKGEYYIYFPLEYVNSSQLTVEQSIIRINYTTQDMKDFTYVSDCYPYFVEYSKSQDTLEELFGN